MPADLSSPDQPDLDALVDDFLADELRENPVRATQLGIDGHDGDLGDFSAGGFSRRRAADDAWLERFRSVSNDELSSDQQIDRELAISTLRGRQVVQDWAVWKRDPATYLGPCLSGLFGLFLHRTSPDATLVDAAESRLRAVPDVLASAKENLDVDLVAPLFALRAQGQARAGVSYFRDLVPAEVEDGPLRRRLAEAGEVAAAAMEDFASHLEHLAQNGGGDWALGEATYSALLTEKERLGYGAAGMRERGQAAYDEIAVEMEDLAERIDGSRDWRTVLERLNLDHPASPEQMREEYEDWTERCRQFLIDTEMVTMPEGESCQVVPSPPFQRPMLAVASYNAPPAFKPSLLGTFFVPFPPDGTSAEDVQKRLQTNSRASIPTISAHEAYPGHHWHLVTIQQNPRTLRKVFGTPYFTEGWGLYAERLMREHGFFSEPAHELAHLDARIFRAARIVVDTSLHMGEMTFEEAVTFMSTKASLSEPTARAEVGRYCSWPTQAASYLTGALEIERIRDRYLGAGLGSLREFNDTIAGSGMLPIELAERAVMGDQ